MKKSILLLCISIILASCFGVKKVKSDAKPISHELWDELLQTNVTRDGCVNYKGFIADSNKLNNYLELVKSHHPNKSWTKNERFAYWMNAYNAFTIQLVIRHYPLISIKDIGGGIYRINTTWAIKFIKIEGNTYSLDNLEHDILRPQFKDARVHVAINCASQSCPPLYNHAFEAAKLDEQLDQLFKAFLTDTTRNNITENNLQLSKIFSWFKGDFKRDEGSLINFLNKYSSKKISDNAQISFNEYNWNLNECME